ncbi:MAG: ectoine/hydroxyectoine ABC transporter permease subunit EhuD [Kiloniellales bacterium]|jgi:polar amino acid transport system permease protein|nr:ectoine/hydroxyectoine ABC transporter permease subunit EhuD [Kiloniellales bacterium]
MEWDWEFIAKILPDLVRGVLVTIQATILGSILAALVGLLIAIARRSSNKWLSRPVGGFATFVRGTPLLVQLYFLFYVLPDVGILLSPLAAGVIGIGLHYSAYTAEVYRAGIDNISKGQWEAAKVCNLSMSQTWRHVIIPQAIPPMIPALANYLIMMFKETPLLSAITVLELMTVARGVANSYYRYFEPMTLVGVFFLLISVPAVIALRAIENKYALRD